MENNNCSININSGSFYILSLVLGSHLWEETLEEQGSPPEWMWEECLKTTFVSVMWSWGFLRVCVVFSRQGWGVWNRRRVCREQCQRNWISNGAFHFPTFFLPLYVTTPVGPGCRLTYEWVTLLIREIWAAVRSHKMKKAMRCRVKNKVGPWSACQGMGDGRGTRRIHGGIRNMGIPRVHRAENTWEGKSEDRGVCGCACTCVHVWIKECVFM